MINLLGKLLFLFWQIVLTRLPLREHRGSVLSLGPARPVHKKQNVYRAIAPGFMLIFDASQPVPKDSQCDYSFGSAFVLTVTAPISLKADDVIHVDSRNGSVEIVERQGIVIWRAAWVN